MEKEVGAKFWRVLNAWVRISDDLVSNREALMVHIAILNYKPPARDFVCSTIHTWVTALFDDGIRFTLMLFSIIFK